MLVFRKTHLIKNCDIKGRSTVSLRLSILEALNTREMEKSTILDLFDIKKQYIIQSKWVKHSNPQPNTLTAGFLITDLGRDKINSVIQSRKTM